MAEIEPQSTLSGQDVSFGARLRLLREAAELTQEELAERAGLTRKAVSVLERGERKRPYPHTVRALADALDLSDHERASLFAAVPKRGTSAAEPATSSEPDLLVPSTPLLGRERELGEINDFLRQVRLLTLTGVGGVGKTRLALGAAREAAESFPDGVTFVGLASLNDVSLVMPTVARSLGVRETGNHSPSEALRTHLRGKRLLLVLDNFEHVAESTPEVAALIEGCENLTVLVTSRAPLRVRGEQEYPVEPLGLPTTTRSPAAGEVMDSPSGRLFVERARATSPTFKLEADNAGVVAAICWRLAGLPLALELAAANTRHLDPAALLSRLDRILSTSGGRDLPARQRTMRASLQWSHDLLNEPERVLFRRLSVFAGGFTVDAAEEVEASEQSGEVEDIVDLLGRLVEQSLVRTDASFGEMRYRMLEPVRQYARERLEASGESEEVRRRHAGYYLALVQRAGPG